MLRVLMVAASLARALLGEKPEQKMEPSQLMPSEAADWRNRNRAYAMMWVLSSILATLPAEQYQSRSLSSVICFFGPVEVENAERADKRSKDI